MTSAAGPAEDTETFCSVLSPDLPHLVTQPQCLTPVLTGALANRVYVKYPEWFLELLFIPALTQALGAVNFVWSCQHRFKPDCLSLAGHLKTCSTSPFLEETSILINRIDAFYKDFGDTLTNKGPLLFERGDTSVITSVGPLKSTSVSVVPNCDCHAEKGKW